MVWSPVSWISCSEHLARAPFPSSKDFYSISFPLANGAAWLAGEIYGIQLPKTILLSFCLPPFVHWEQLATSGMVDLHVPRGRFVGRPPSFQTLVRLPQPLKNVVMEMLRPVPPLRFWVLAS